MDFALTTRQTELRDRVRDFVQDRIRPRMSEFHYEAASEPRWKAIGVLEELKSEARKAGLWNLFMPPASGSPLVDNSFVFEGVQLSNLEYALCAEEMGRIH